jgi:hypothetical protein
MQFLHNLADAAVFSATAGSDITSFSCVMGALRDLSIALVKGNEEVYREALHVYATAGGTAAHTGATVPAVDPEYCCSCCGVYCLVPKGSHCFCTACLQPLCTFVLS